MKKLFILLFTVFLSVGSLSAQSTDIKKLKQLANQGLAEAQFSLGLMYYNGEGVPQDNAQARIESSSNTGSPTNTESSEDLNKKNIVKTTFGNHLLSPEEYQKRKTTYEAPETWWKYIPIEERQKIEKEMVQENMRKEYINEISAQAKKELEKEKREKTSVIGRIFEFILGAAVVGGIIGFLISLWGGTSDTKESTLTGAGVGAMASIGCLWEVFKLVLGFMIVMWVLSFIFGN